ncbi:MAG: hypothetical protein WKF95_06870 [Rubrobacter sp.]
MVKPVILAVDDDPQILRAVERDLRPRYAREYRVQRADSGELVLNYYPQKPWDPPDHNLIPRLDEQLPNWRADHRPVFERLPLDVGTQNGG